MQNHSILFEMFELTFISFIDKRLKAMPTPTNSNQFLQFLLRLLSKQLFLELKQISIMSVPIGSS